ncbi:MAG: 30S ribosomal protein S9 [Sphaerochaetaceae bacterium]|nr:30S ribosomal protein S9 [Sphaerochaetaceae bacterium]
MAKKETVKTNVNLGQGTGRRKTATARVYLREGSGNITINGRALEDYFKDPLCVFMVKQPLDVTDNLTKFDIVITVAGGGQSGQAGACRHGIARALVAENEANKPALHANGFLTRDPRMVERKKYGQRGARRRFQFSKR